MSEGMLNPRNYVGPLARLIVDSIQSTEILVLVTYRDASALLATVAGDQRGHEQHDSRLERACQHLEWSYSRNLHGTRNRGLLPEGGAG